MNISVKKFSKKSLSLLIALVMIISALPFSPLSSPIEANAAEVKTNIDVWDANNATVVYNSNPRYSFKDSDTEYSLSGVRWGGSTLNTNSSDNTKYLTIGNASLSCATLSSSNESTPPTASGFAGKNIKGKKWSFSAKFAYTGPNTSGTYTATTVFGIGTSDTYTYANKSSNYNETDSMVANLVDIRENGNIYIALSNETSTPINPTLTLSEENRNKLATDSASNPKVLTVTYDNGSLSIDINGDVIVAPREVDSALFEKGVSNFFMGANVQVYRGGNPAPYYKVSNSDAYIYNMNLYSLSGATYEQEGSGGEITPSPVEPDVVTPSLPNPTVAVDEQYLTLRWLASSDFTDDATTNDKRAGTTGTITWDKSHTYSAANFNGSSFMNYKVDSNLLDIGLTSRIETDGNLGTTIAFMAYSNNNNDTPFFEIYNDYYDVSGKKTQFSITPAGNVYYANSAGSTHNSSFTQPSSGAWHTYIIKFYPSKKLSIYVDGVAVKDGEQSDYYDNHTFDIPNTIQVGANKAATSKFNGSIRDFRIYRIDKDVTTLHQNLLNVANNTKTGYDVGCITADKQTVVGQSVSSRKDSNKGINIVNDGQNNSVSIGIFRFDISEIKNNNYHIDDNIRLNLSVNDTWFHNSDTNSANKTNSTYLSTYASIYTDVYYSLNDLSTYTNNEYNNVANTVVALDTNSSTTEATVTSNVNNVGGSGTTKLGSLKHLKRDGQALTGDINISQAIKEAIENDKQYVYILLAKNKYDGSAGQQPWSDTWFRMSEQTITYEKKKDYIFTNHFGQLVRTVVTDNQSTALKHKPDLSPTEYTTLGNNQHRKTEYFNWQISDLADLNCVSFVEQSTDSTEDCAGGTATCQELAVCNNCKSSYGDLLDHSYTNSNYVVPTNADENSYTEYTCSMCSSLRDTVVYDDVSSYWESYELQLIKSQDEIANTAKYTSDSIKAVQDIIDEVSPVKGSHTKSRAYIERKTTELTEAVAGLVLNKYTVTLRFKNENGVTVTNPEDSKSYKVIENIPYGDVAIAAVPTALEESGYSVYKWIRIDGNNDVLSGLNSNSLNVMVKKNMEYWVYLKKTAVDDSQATGKAVVTINNKSNKVYDIGYIGLNENTTVSVSSNNITIGGVTLTAPVYSFYNITGFNINGKIVTGTDTVSITKDTVIKPVYEPTLDAFIKRAENETFLINGKAEDLAVKWNQKVVLTTSNGSEVAWIAGIDRNGNGTIESTEKNVVGYGSSYSFYANSDVTFYTELTTVDAPKTSIGLFSYNANENKVTLVNNFYAPSGYTVKYAGVVLSTKTNDRATLMDQTNGRFQGGESDFSGTDLNKNQLRISVSRTATTNFDMHALAYIIVEKPDGTEETVYADNVETIHYTA